MGRKMFFPSLKFSVADTIKLKHAIRKMCVNCTRGHKIDRHISRLGPRKEHVGGMEEPENNECFSAGSE